MTGLFKYIVSVATVISAVVMGAIFLDSAAIVDTSLTVSPKWKIERLKVDPDLPYIAQGSLSPIYPATPGKELLRKPIAVQPQTRHEPVSAKAISKDANATPVHFRQAHETPKLPRQIYATGEYSHLFATGLGYADGPPRRLLILEHAIY
jgi:hypothetical protein